MTGAGWAFVYRAGTFIFASMILVWAMLYFPTTMPDGRSYDVKSAELDKELDRLKGELKALEEQKANPDLIEAHKDEVESKENELNGVYGDWKRQSLLGRAGKELEPAFAPLGWDWKIGMAALASFPAREVVVGTLGMIYDLGGEVDAKDINVTGAADSPLGKAIKENWHSETGSPRSEHPTAVALSLLVFFALCCQCASTLAVIRRETNSWRWPAFTFIYMTALAYLGAMAAYQAGKLFGG
jgi:ferrous iron transport protein B